jgi:hypothetical protein
MKKWQSRGKPWASEMNGSRGRRKKNHVYSKNALWQKLYKNQQFY